MLKRLQQRRKKGDDAFEKFVTGGNEKADELAKAGAMLDEGFMSEARSRTVQEEVRAALQYLSGGRMERLRRAQAEARRKVNLRRQERKRGIEPSNVLKPATIVA